MLYIAFDSDIFVLKMQVSIHSTNYLHLGEIKQNKRHVINIVRMQHPEGKLVCGSYKSFSYVLSDLRLANALVSAFRPKTTD